MQSLDHRVYCIDCLEPTYHEIRYRSDFQFIGRILVCSTCGSEIFEPLGKGLSCQHC